jgi:hypothetical protein
MPPRPCFCHHGHGFFTGQVPDDQKCPIDGTPISSFAHLTWVCEAEHRFDDAQVPKDRRCPIDRSLVRRVK